MQFDGMKSLPEERPLVEIESDGEFLDLHNDGDLYDFAYDFPARVFRVSWTMKRPARLAPHLPEPGQRATVASATLVLSGVRSARLSGTFASPTQRDSGGLDFIEYRRRGLGLGELRFVLENEAELVITASRCEFRMTRG